MKTQNAIISVTGVICIALGIAAWNFVQAARTSESALTAITDGDTRLRVEIAAARARAASLDAKLRELRPQLETARAKPVEPAATRPAVMALDAKAAAAMEALARVPWRDVVLEKSPELQARYLLVRRREIEAACGPFWAAAGLDGAQVDEFKAILIAAAERTLDLRSAARAKGLDESDPAVVTLRKESEAVTRAAQRELLGTARYEQLVEYERTLPMRGFVSSLAGSLVLADAPLSGAQADQLTQILAESNEAYRRGERADSPGPDIDGPMRRREAARESFDSRRALAEARRVLSPVQFERFESELLRIRSVTELYNVIRQTPGETVIGFTFIGRK